MAMDHGRGSENQPGLVWMHIFGQTRLYLNGVETVDSFSSFR